MKQIHCKPRRRAHLGPMLIKPGQRPEHLGMGRTGGSARLVYVGVHRSVVRAKMQAESRAQSGRYPWDKAVRDRMAFGVMATVEEVIKKKRVRRKKPAADTVIVGD